jgi:hypothetical protein
VTLAKIDMKILTIGKRIISSLAALILITAALGALAIISLRCAAIETRQLAQCEVPQVRVANRLQPAQSTAVLKAGSLVNFQAFTCESSSQPPPPAD